MISASLRFEDCNWPAKKSCEFNSQIIISEIIARKYLQLIQKWLAKCPCLLSSQYLTIDWLVSAHNFSLIDWRSLAPRDLELGQSDRFRSLQVATILQEKLDLCCLRLCLGINNAQLHLLLIDRNKTAFHWQECDHCSQIRGPSYWCSRTPSESTLSKSLLPTKLIRDKHGNVFHYQQFVWRSIDRFIESVIHAGLLQQMMLLFIHFHFAAAMCQTNSVFLGENLHYNRWYNWENVTQVKRQVKDWPKLCVWSQLLWWSSEMRN